MADPSTDPGAPDALGLPPAFLQLPQQPGAVPPAPAPQPAFGGVHGAIVGELRNGGASEAAIRGILANVQDESNFNPALRHPDQPHWGGEAHYAHGLYQEGGQEWNNYQSWLNQNGHSDWTDPALQTRFLVQNLKSNYPDVWHGLNNGTPEQAAQTFVSGYLKPASQYEAARRAQYAQGIPAIEDYASGAVRSIGNGASSLAQTLAQPARRALGMAETDTYGNGPAGFAGNPRMAELLMSQALAPTPNNQVGYGNMVGKLAMLLAGRNMTAAQQESLTHALGGQQGGSQSGSQAASSSPLDYITSLPKKAMGAISDALTVPSSPSARARSQAPSSTPQSGPAPAFTNGPRPEAASPAVAVGSPEGAAPQTPALPAMGGVQPGAPASLPGSEKPAAAPAMPGGQAPSTLDAHGLPEFIPPVHGIKRPSEFLPPAPAIAAISYSNPQLAAELQKQRMEAIMKENEVGQITHPSGRVYMGNPFTGYHLSGLPGMPPVENTPIEANGVKTTLHQEPVFDAQGRRQGYRTLPGLPAAGAPAAQPGEPAAASAARPAAQKPEEYPAGGTVADKLAWADRAQAPAAKTNIERDEFPQTGNVADMAGWAERNKTRAEVSKAQGDQVGKMETDINQKAENALSVKSTLGEMQNLAQGFSPNMGTDVKAHIGNAFVGLGVDPEKVNKWMGMNVGDVEAFKKNTAYLAIEAVKQISNRATQMEFQRFLENNPNILMTGPGMQRVIDRMTKVADLQVDKQSAWNLYKDQHPSDKWTGFESKWSAIERKEIEGGSQNSANPLGHPGTPAPAGSPAAGTAAQSAPSPSAPAGAPPSAAQHSAEELAAELKRRGLPMPGMGVKPEPPQQSAPSSAPATVPSRPGAVPQGSMYSPSRHAWKTPDGRIIPHDQAGQAQ